MKNTTHYFATFLTIVSLVTVNPLFAVATSTSRVTFESTITSSVSESDIVQYLLHLDLTLLKYWNIDGSEDILVTTTEGILLHLYVKDGIIINSNEVPIE